MARWPLVFEILRTVEWELGVTDIGGYSTHIGGGSIGASAAGGVVVCAGGTIGACGPAISGSAAGGVGCAAVGKVSSLAWDTWKDSGDRRTIAAVAVEYFWWPLSLKYSERNTPLLRCLR